MFVFIFLLLCVSVSGLMPWGTCRCQRTQLEGQALLPPYGFWKPFLDLVAGGWFYQLSHLISPCLYVSIVISVLPILHWLEKWISFLKTNKNTLQILTLFKISKPLNLRIYIHVLWFSDIGHDMSKLSRVQSKDERDLLKDLMKRFNEIHLDNTLHRP